MKISISILTAMVCLSVLTLVSGCKKDSATITGNWKLTNIQGTGNYYYATAYDTVITYTNITYNSATGAVTTAHTGNNHDTTSMLYTLQMNIQSGGVLTLTETDTVSYTGSNTITTTGSWDYLSSTGTNGLALSNISNSLLINYLVSSYGTYVVQVQSLTSNTMVLSYTSDYSTTSPPYQSNITETLTFSR